MTTRDRGYWLRFGSRILFGLAVIGWVALLRPEGLGGPAAYVIVTGDSMEPTMSDGDFVVARRQASYEIGDVVVFPIPEDDVGGGKLIVHRIIGGNGEQGYELRGDNRDTSDLWKPTAEEVTGKVWLTIPSAGRFVRLLRSPLVAAIFAAFVAFLFVVVPERKDRQPRAQARRDTPPPPPRVPRPPAPRVPRPPSQAGREGAPARRPPPPPPPGRSTIKSA